MRCWCSALPVGPACADGTVPGPVRVPGGASPTGRAGAPLHRGDAYGHPRLRSLPQCSALRKGETAINRAVAKEDK